MPPPSEYLVSLVTSSFCTLSIACKIKIHRLLKELVIAIQSYLKAHAFIRRHNLWKWILVPGAIYMMIFGASIYFFGKSANRVIAYLMIETGLQHWVQTFQSGLLGFLFTFAGIVLWILLMLFYFSLFKYIFLIIGSPVFAYLSERTEAIIEEKEFHFSWKQLFKDMARGIRLALRNCLRQTLYIIGFLLLSFVPVAGWITPLVILMIECYYYGFSMLDYSCERHKLSPSESILYISKHKGLAIGNGLLFYLMHGIPLIGWLLAPSYAVVAATISLYQKD